MKKLLLIIPTILSITACSNMGGGTYSGGNEADYMTHHSADSKGRSAFPATRVATGKKVFLFDPKLAAWAAYDESGNRVKTGRASGGKDYCPDVGEPCRTVTGKYRVYSKKGADCTSSKYPIEEGGGAAMPHCMHFYRGFAIHGAYSVPNYNASHGCVRVLPSAAKWLNNEFLNVGSTVIVRPY